MVLKMKNSVKGFERKGEKIPWIVEQMIDTKNKREKIRKFTSPFRRLIQHQNHSFKENTRQEEIIKKNNNNNPK